MSKTIVEGWAWNTPLNLPVTKEDLAEGVAFLKLYNEVAAQYLGTKIRITIETIEEGEKPYDLL